MSPENCYVFDLVLEEMGSNIIRYGYDDDICHEIMLSVEFQDNSAILELRDNGHAFNPLTDAPVPGLDLPLAERKIGGMGIYLTRKMCRNLTYRRDGCWNILTMEIGNKDR